MATTPWKNTGNGFQSREVDGKLERRVVMSTGNEVFDISNEINERELSDNKQDSLEADGTGKKYPTVDAVNNILGPEGTISANTTGNSSTSTNSKKWDGFTNVFEAGSVSGAVNGIVAFDEGNGIFRFNAESIMQFLKAASKSEVRIWNNFGVNAESLNGFQSKLLRVDTNDNNLLTVLLWGDSVFGRLYREEMSNVPNAINAAPGMYRSNVAYKIFEPLQIQGQNLKYYPVKNMTGFVSQDNPFIDPPINYPADSSFISLSGDWTEHTNTDYIYYKKSTVDGSSIEFTLDSGFTYASLIAQRSLDSAVNIDVLVSINGAAYQTPSSAGLIGEDSFSLQKPNTAYSNKFQRYFRQEWSGLTASASYKFKFTINGLNSFWVWGMECWSLPSLRIINAARGGHTIEDLNRYIDDDILSDNYKADVAFFELPMLNDSFVDDIDTTFDNLDIALNRISESGMPTILLTPNPSDIEPDNYIKFIKAARVSASKYGFPLIDIYDKWRQLDLDGTADGTHLNNEGVQYYSEEIVKLINAEGSYSGGGSNISSKKTIPEYTDNSDAISNGLKIGMKYRTGDVLKVVH